MGLKLLCGKLVAAWRDYPRTVREVRRISAGPPILITGTHRSGTTWAAAMLATPGLWYVHEPFFTGKGLWHENFTYLRKAKCEPRVDRIVKAVLRGGHRFALHHPWAEHPLMPMRLLPPPRPRRVLLKDPMACLMSEYLTEHFGFQTLVLFRHPAGFAWSVTRLQWPLGIIIRQFLADDTLMQDWLEPYRQLMETTHQQDDLRSATVLYGCLNVVLWAYTRRHPGMRGLSFEELCIEPVERFADLYQQLGLRYDDAVEARHQSLCFAGTPAEGRYHAHEVRRNSREMAVRWRVKLGEKEQSEVRRIWERFDVPLYQDSGCW